MPEFRNVNVYRPSDRTIRLQGGTRTVNNSLGSSAGEGIGSIIGFFMQRKQDSDNREILRGLGLPDDAIENMSSAALDASVTTNVPLAEKGKAIQQASENITQNMLNNSDYVDGNTMEEQIAKGRTAPIGRLQREDSPMQFGSANPPSTTVHDANPTDSSPQSPEAAKFVRDLDVLRKMFKPDADAAADTAEIDPEAILMDEVGVNAARSSIEGVNLGTGTARKKGQSEVFQDSIEELTNLQAGRVDDSNILSKLQGKAVADDNALFDRETKVAVARNKETLRPTTMIKFDKNGNAVSIRAVHDLRNNTIRAAKGVNNDDVYVPQTVSLTKTENADHPALGAYLKDTTTDIKDVFNLQGQYQQAADLMDDDFFGVINEFKTDFFQFVDKRGIVDLRHKDAARMQKAVNFIKLTRQIFLQEKIAVTGLAAPVQEAESLEETFINFQNMGKEQLRGFLVGNMARLQERSNEGIETMDDFEKMRKDKRISLPSLLRHRSDRLENKRRESGFLGTSGGQVDEKEKKKNLKNRIDAQIKKGVN